MGVASAESVLHWLVGISIVGYLLLAARLWRTGLFHVYHFFSVYILVEFTRTATLSLIPPRTNLYGYVWVAAEPFAWILYILVVLELYGLVLKSFVGIATLGRRVLGVAVAVALGVSVLTLLPGLGDSPQPYPVLHYVYILERGVVSSLVILLLLITSFMVWYPVPLSRNLVTHFVLFAMYFLSKTVLLLLLQITAQQVTRAISVGLLVMVNVCLVCWITLLKRVGERQTVVVGHQWNPDREKELVANLNAINDALLRSSRK